jgi:D-amino-acid oxidase
LQESGIPNKKTAAPSILVVAEDFPGSTSINYASSWAGAHYRPVSGTTPELQTEAEWARYAYTVFEKLAEDEPGAGVQFMEGIEHFDSTPLQEYLHDIQECLAKKKSGRQLLGDDGKPINAYEHLMPSLRLLPSEELPSGVQYGFSYRTFCVNPPVYCDHLLRKFILQGGRTRQYRLADLREASYLAENIKVIVNCSGRGFRDPKSYIVRGKVSNQPCLARHSIFTNTNEQGTPSSFVTLVLTLSLAIYRMAAGRFVFPVLWMEEL